MFAEIRTQRLRLRVLTATDAPKMHAYRSRPEVLQFQSCKAKSLDEVQTFIASMVNVNLNEPGWNQIAIELLENGSVVGDCGIHILKDARIAEFGITLDPRHHSKGYATEALKAILELLFLKYKKHRVIASVDRAIYLR